MRFGLIRCLRGAQINWHVPGDREITFVLRILREIAAPILGELEQLLHAPRSEKLTDRIWANDFCRRLAILKTTFSGFFALIGLPSAEPAGESVSDRPDSIPGFHERDIKVVTGIVLPDEKDVRYQEIRQLQHRIGRFLHDAAVHLKDVASDDSFDAVKMLMCACDACICKDRSSNNAQFVHPHLLHRSPFRHQHLSRLQEGALSSSVSIPIH